MKTFKEFLAEQANSDYKVGDTLKFNVQAVGQYADVQALGGFDWGTVVKADGTSYTLRIDNGNEVVIKADDIYSYGNADATP
jgi:hypothetical protein